VLLNLMLVLIIVVLLCVIVVKILKGKQIIIINIATERIKELALYQFPYTSDPIEYKDPLKFPFLKYFFNKSTPLIVSGVIKIGINLEKMKISKSQDKVDINIPELIIVGHEVKIIGIQSKHDIYEFQKFISNWKREKEEALLKDSEVIINAYRDIKEIITKTLLVSNIKKINFTPEAPILLLPEAPN